MSTLHPSVFDTVPERDYFSLFQDGQPKYSEVVQAYKFKKEDVSRATGIPLNSVRFDSRIPRELKDRITEWANLLNLVAEHYNGDLSKTTLWFTIQNPLLGNATPRDMIRFGRYNKLVRFIQNALDENKR